VVGGGDGDQAELPVIETVNVIGAAPEFWN
jgi:hypothetical protein